MKGILIIAVFVAAGNLCNAGELAVNGERELRAIAATRRDIVLLSWRHGDSNPNYILLTERNYSAIMHRQFSSPVRDEFQSLGILTGTDALKQVIKALPTDSLITWRQYPPAGTFIPEPELFQDIRRFAAASRVELKLGESNDASDKSDKGSN